MSFRPELKPYQVITSGSMAGDITSLVTLIPKLSLVSYTVSWSGTAPVGTLSMQISNDYSLDSTGAVQNTGNWSALSFYNRGTAAQVTTIAVSGATGADNLVTGLCGAYAIRLIYTRTSGTGTLQAYVCGKVA